MKGRRCGRLSLGQGGRCNYKAVAVRCRYLFNQASDGDCRRKSWLRNCVQKGVCRGGNREPQIKVSRRETISRGRGAEEVKRFGGADGEMLEPEMLSEVLQRCPARCCCCTGTDAGTAGDAAHSDRFGLALVGYPCGGGS